MKDGRQMRRPHHKRCQLRRATQLPRFRASSILLVKLYLQGPGTGMTSLLSFSAIMFAVLEVELP